MPSWQARVLNACLRALIKRHVPEDDAVAVRLMRRKLEPKWARPRLPRGVRVVPVEEGAVRGEWLLPDAGAKRTLYYLHGGGYIACSPRTHRGFTATIAREAEAEVFALDYRLAPEHRYPAAVEDAVSGYRWLLAQGRRPEDITVGGDSAGGGLTMALLQRLRDLGLPMPRAAFCFSPWVDLEGTGASLAANDAHDPMFYGANIHRAGQLYAGETPLRDPYVSPIYGDLRGLPPLLLYVSDIEILLDDSTRLAARARACGVETDLRVWQGLPHVWPIFVAFGLPEARAAVGEVAAFLRQPLASAQDKRSAA